MAVRIPRRLAADPNWGPYLRASSQPVAELADQVRRTTPAATVAWAAQRPPLPAELIVDIQVWRAATQVDPSDLRPTGPPQIGRTSRIFQLQLDQRLAATETRTGREWRQLVAAQAPSATRDPFLPELEDRLSDPTRSGFDATHLLRSAAAAGRLPDDHPPPSSGAASSTNYRKPNPQLQRPGARPLGPRCRA